MDHKAWIPARWRARIVVAVLLAAGLALGGAGSVSSAGSSEAGFAATDSLTLQACRDRALAHHPLLAAREAEVEAAAAEARQAGAWANPELALEVEDFGGDRPGWDQAQTTVSVSLALEPFGTRGARRAAGEAGRAAAAAGAASTRRDLLAEVDLRFVALLAAQARREALAGAAAATDTLLAAVTELVAAGEVSPIELDRARIERARAAAALRQAAGELAAARLALAELWGGGGAALTALGELGALPPLPARDAVAGAPLESPELAQWSSEAARQRAQASLAARERWPAPVVSAGLRRYEESREQAFTAAVALPLPLLDRRGAALAAARARERTAQRHHEAEAARLGAGRLAAWERLAAARQAALLLRDAALAGARDAHAAVALGYRRGKLPLLDLLDARRTLAETELAYVEALAATRAAAVELERWLGRPLAGLPEGESR